MSKQKPESEIENFESDEPTKKILDIGKLRQEIIEQYYKKPSVFILDIKSRAYEIFNKIIAGKENGRRLKLIGMEIISWQVARLSLQKTFETVDKENTFFDLTVFLVKKSNLEKIVQPVLKEFEIVEDFIGLALRRAQELVQTFIDNTSSEDDYFPAFNLVGVVLANYFLEYSAKKISDIDLPTMVEDYFIPRDKIVDLREKIQDRTLQIVQGIMDQKTSVPHETAIVEIIAQSTAMINISPMADVICQRMGCSLDDLKENIIEESIENDNRI